MRAVFGLMAVAVVVALGLGLAWPTMRVNRGIFHHLQHDHLRAIQILSEAELGPPSFLPVHYLVASHIRLGQRDQALGVLEELTGRYPQWASPHLEQGVLMLREGEWEEGWPKFAHAADLAKLAGAAPLSEEELIMAEAVTALSQNRIRATLTSVAPLRGEGGDYEDIVALVEATALFRLGLWEEAREPLEVCLELTPTNPRPAAMMALEHAAEGEWHAARLWFDRARNLDPSQANEILIGTLRRGIQLANTASLGGESMSRLSRTAALAWLSDIWAKAEQWDAVLAVLDAQPSPELLTHHIIWHHWADALEEVGEEEEAETARDRRDEINPAWNLSPDWPQTDFFGRLGWRPRGREWVSLDWIRIPLPLEEERLQEGTAPFGEGGQELNVFLSQEIDFPVEVSTPGWYRVIFNLSGRVSGLIWPVVEISAPPAPPILKYVNAYHPHYHVAVLYLEPGVNTVRLSYVNDSERLAAGEDRNLIIADVWVERDPLIRGDQ
jgi:tetratricopeptide (TPR) repeat protein